MQQGSGLGRRVPGAGRLAVSPSACPRAASSSTRELQQPHFTDGATEAKVNGGGKGQQDMVAGQGPFGKREVGSRRVAHGFGF